MGGGSTERKKTEIAKVAKVSGARAPSVTWISQKSLTVDGIVPRTSKRNGVARRLMSLSSESLELSWMSASMNTCRRISGFALERYMSSAGPEAANEIAWQWRRRGFRWRLPMPCEKKPSCLESLALERDPSFSAGQGKSQSDRTVPNKRAAISSRHRPESGSVVFASSDR